MKDQTQQMLSSFVDASQGWCTYYYVFEKNCPQN